MKNLWIALLPLCCMVAVPAFSQLYNNGAAITISSGTTVVVNSGATSTVGFFNQGTVQNNGKIILGITSGMSEIGILNTGVFNNNACAEISMLAPFSNTSTFNNSGLFTINTSAAHTNSSLLNNGIINYLQDNLIPNVVNNEIIIAPTNSNECGAISPAFILNNPVEFTIIGIFTDEPATISAGTFDVASNTFTPTVQLAEGIYDFFVKIEDSNNCISVVPWQLTTEDCCDAPVAICQPFTAFLDGNTVSVSAQHVNNNSITDCGLQSMVVSPNNFDCSHVGTPQVVTLIVTDQRGKTGSCTATVIVDDNTPPTIECFNQTISFNGEMSILLDPDDIVDADDNCGIQNISLSPNSIASAQVGLTIPVLVTVTDINGNTATCTSQITASGLPPGWSQTSNGVGCANGNDIDYNPSTQVWTASSTNCFYGPPYTEDAMGFGQRTLCGNGSITAEVTGISGTSLGWAGIVMRETNAPGSKKVQVMSNLSNFLRREVRTVTNGPAVPQQFPSNNRNWLRLVRTGNQIVTFSSPNGVNWFQILVVNVPMNSCVEMGLVVTNYNQNSTVTATFANVSFTGNGPIMPASNPDNDLVEMANNQPDFSVYPNPTSGELNIDLQQYIGKNIQMELYSLEGKLMQLIQLNEVLQNSQTLLLDRYASGMYFVKLRSAGLPDVTKRVVLLKG